MATLDKIVSDPDFQSLPKEEKVKALFAMDDDFARLSESEQFKAVEAFEAPTFGHRVTTPEPPQDKPLPRYGEAIGSIGGGLLGVASRVPTAPFALSAAGAAAGELVQTGIEKIAGLTTPEAYKTSKGTEQELLKAAGRGAASELGGRVIGVAFRPVGRTLEGFRTKVIQGAKSINEELEQFGSGLLASQATESTILDIADNFASGGFVSAGKMEAHRRGQAVAVEEMGKEFVEKFLKGADIEDVGNAFVDVIIKNKQLSRDVSDMMYTGVDKATKGTAKVPMLPVFKALKDTPRLQKELNKVLRANGLTPSEDIALSFRDASALRSDLISSIKKLDQAKALTGKEQRRLKIISGLVDTQMAKSAEKAGVYNTWRQANLQFKEASETFHNDFIRELVKKDAYTTGDRLGKIKTPEQARQIIKATDRETQELIKGAYISDILNKASKATARIEETGSLTLSGKAIQEELKRRPDKVMQELLGDDLRKLNLLAKTAFLTEKQESASGAFKVAISLMQPTALLTLGTGVATGNVPSMIIGGTLVLSPLAFGKLLRSSKGRDILIKGMTSKTGTSNAAEVLAKASLLLGPDLIKRMEENKQGE